MVPFATHRLPPIGYPAFERYYETTTTATSVIPRASVPLAREFPRCSRYFAHIGRGKLGPCARTLVSRCHPFPAVNCGNGAALPAFQDTPIYLCPALSSRPGPRARGLRPIMVATYCEHGGVVPLRRNRKTLAIGLAFESQSHGFGIRSIRFVRTLRLRPGRAGGCPPTPPQTRTSAINASGSSKRGFANGGYVPRAWGDV